MAGKTVEEICACAQEGSFGEREWHSYVLQLLCRIASVEVQFQEFTMNLAQNAGTYDLFTADGDVLIKSITYYVDTTATGLTSVSAATNDTTPVTLLSSVAAAAITAGKNLTPYNGPTLLADTKKGQYTIVGNGTAGQITAIVEYVAIADGSLV